MLHQICSSEFIDSHIEPYIDPFRGCVTHSGQLWDESCTVGTVAWHFVESSSAWWLQGELFIIDVSQSVDLDHPRALDFLREDIQHINAFFRRAGVATLTMRELFDFVVDTKITAGNIDVALLGLMNLAAR